ncbi:MBL fold metallo-hydrolase [Roseateles violae]|uniref:MBL fold metallo-hydrolase n=1 Tax=Roseateles violae TaxID=3058042 RepID=A0ABT8DQ84_9BURK|nr:MBL fold metallo-hydrolase [Pelomonas sp. PFR6]MDN3920515.1 MBL fold metallo-hydrolase [Pelomonas sp. PFR6]
MRHLLRSLLLSLLLCLSPPLRAAPEAIADGVYLLRGHFEPGRQPDGNSVLLRGSEGWVLIDSGRHRAHTQQLLDFTAGDLKAVVNTHWHLDHLGGNAWLRERQPGLLVYASAEVERALAGWLAQTRRQMQALVDDGKTPEAARAQMRIDLDLLAQGAALLPDRRIEAPLSALAPAGRALRLGLESGVSGGDVWVLDEASGTLIAGDLLTLPVPFLDTACAEAWSAALRRLEVQPFERLVPGHGPVLDRAGLRRYRRAFDGLLACAAGDRPVADCAAAWLSDLDGLIAEADKPRTLGLLSYYFKAHLRAAPEQRLRFCAAPP